jgi:phenylalanine ammonia-lyase
VYEFVRLTLGIKMQGAENYASFVNGLGVDEETIGQKVSLIHEVCSFLPFIAPRVLNTHHQAIRDGKMQPVIVGLFA